MERIIKTIFERRISLALVCVLQAANVLAGVPEVKIATSPLYVCASNLSPATRSSSDGVNGALSSGAVSTTILSADPAYVYLASFNRARWSGHFKKYTLNLDPNGIPKISEVANWDAADILTGTDRRVAIPSPDERKIYTTTDRIDKSLATIEFNWGSLSADQKTVLNISPATGKKDGFGESRLNYLRGARNLEQGNPGGTFRLRDSVLGDIVNSNSVYVGAPAANVQGRDYHKFYETHKNRTNAVYVGANDGMLHAFDAENGHELFSYIPQSLLPFLNQLTRPDFVHRPFVDGLLSVSEAMVAGGWNTVLASGMGGGAQGVFALDVSDPADFSGGSGVLWEFTDSDDADMGNQMGPPMIGKFRISTTKGIAEYRYFVVVSSGLNNYKEDGTGKYDASGAGALFLLSLDKAPSEKWRRNVNYFKFKTPIIDPTSQNGLSAPSLVVGNNGAVRYIYAGDLQGNIWRFDFGGQAPWTHARLGNVPLFTASDSHGHPQPITTQPKIIFAPGGGYLILFGTGKYIEESDSLSGSFKTQSFYGVYDALQSMNAAIVRNRLASRIVSADRDSGIKIVGPDITYGKGPDSKLGWYFDFLDSDKSGERSITNPVAVEGRLFFNTLIPSAHCAKGAGRSYTLDGLTGLSILDGTTGYMSDIGALASPIIFQTGISQTGTSPTGTAKIKRKSIVLNFGTSGDKGAIAQVKTGDVGLHSIEAPAKRLGWREVLNWQELRDAVNGK